MRAPYDQTCDLRYGPDATLNPPLTIYAAGVLCRVVPADKLVSIGLRGDIVPIAYLTLEGVSVTLAELYTTGTLGDTRVVTSAGTQVAFPTGGIFNHYISGADLMINVEGGNYLRFWLAPLPYSP